MIQHLSKLLLCLLLGVGTSTLAQINPQFIGRYSTGIYNAAAAEISAYDALSKRMFVTNGPDTSLKVVDISNPANPIQVNSFSIKPYGSDLTSVACYNGIVAIAVIDSLGKTENGKVVFLNAATLAYINQVDVGPLPDMLTFSPDGKKVLVANEGEPNVGYTIDPEGSVSIIDVSNGVANITQANVQTAGFTSFNNQSIDPKIKITGRIQSGGTFLRNATIAEDLEPEYIAISANSQTAWVTCQENNCIAVIDIPSATVTSLIPLGFKNYNLPDNKMDASDQGGTINITNYPVFGMYQPDAIASFQVGSTTYLATANEGDARADWGAANVEEIRFGNAGYVVDTVKFGGTSNVTAMKANTAMGRLNVTNRFGDFDNDGKFDSVFCFGARSFTIWNGTTGSLVWDSKDEFEQRTAAIYAANFNASNSNNTLKNRSDDKGPEPEAIAIGKILDSTYAFIGLERIGGVMIYNITNPTAPYFVNYINTRDFAVTPSLANLNTVGDLGPEGLVFVPAAQSPSGKDLLLVSNEISGTVAIIQLNSRSAFQMQILHSSDMESGLAAVVDAPNYAAIVDKLEDQHVNTLILSSGDNTLPGPFLSAGEDPSLQTPLRNTASLYYSGTQALRAAIGRTDIAIMNIIGFNASAFGNHEFDLGTTDLNGQIGVDIRNSGADKRWVGAQFPYVSCNLNFSNDANLNYLFTNQILRDTAFRTSPTITANSQKRGIAPSVIIVRNGEKIGIVGATTQVLARISSPGFTSVIGPQVDDMPALAAIIQPVVDSLISKEGVNKIILLAHLQQIANEKALAPLLRDVDIIISGGNHAFTADGNDRLGAGVVATERYPIITQSSTAKPMVILNTTSEWKYVGRFVCDFNTNGELLLNVLDSNINGAYIADSAMVTSLWGNYSDAFAAGTKGAGVRTLCTAIGNVITTKDGNLFGKSNVFLEGRRNAVRTEETNLGNLSADANLWYARQYDPQVRVSIKNGGGIRSAIGFVNAVGGNAVLEPTQANPSASKARGDISQLDIENSLRFNNSLVIVTTTAGGLRRLLEHGISATRPGATPGQFPQVGGVAFSYDTARTLGNELWSLVITDSLGNRTDTIVRNGLLVGDTTRTYKIVTLNFLANPSSGGSPVGGDGYPFPSVTTARVNLDTAIKTTGTATFAGIGSEQDAFAEYMLARHNTVATAFSVRDTTLQGDRRIQLLNARPDAIFPETNPAISIAAARTIAPPSLVRVRGIVSRAWGRFIYIQDSTGGIGVRQSSGAMVDAITAGTLKEGDSVEVIGPRNDFNNYAQIQLASGVFTGANTVIVLGSNKNVTPITITVKQLNQGGEQYESRLVRILGLRTNVSGTFAASTNYTVWDGTTTGDTTVLRVIAATDTEVEDAPALSIPNGEFVFEGILAQFCSGSSGCTTGYQLYGIRKKDIRPVLGTFALAAPANNTRLVTAANNQTNVNIQWTRSGNALSYKWFLTSANGTFTNPIVVLPANNNGVDTTLTLTVGRIDSLLAQLAIAQGDSVQTQWTVYSYLGNDSLKAGQNFNLHLVRQAAPIVLGSFNLSNPVNNTRVTVEQGNQSLITINWTKSANAQRYRWKATTVTGSFTTPLLDLPSNTNGTDSALTLTSEALDATLKSLGIARKDSVTLKWTVYAYRNTDSLKATNDFQITLIRKRILGNFTLTAPANNQTLGVDSNTTTPVNITWNASSNATRYEWLAILPGGNFNAPLLRFNSNNNGQNTTLTLISGAIDSIVANLGIAKGDSVLINWNVRAIEPEDSILANETFALTIRRNKAVGLAKIDLSNQFTIYPIPATESLNIKSNNGIVNATIRLIDLNGKLVSDTFVTKDLANTSIPVDGLSAGVYVLLIETNEGIARVKVNIH
ncbi:MAG: choice-of-anchor I family protein [Bacteroidia bacterium]|jgi:2',3'-cyclic-nucleotide 2'-phosphodiesterase (5'-nucleotidase family)|nr:choice-of-anchor I family protein [Bacteroidia bacterium]